VILALCSFCLSNTISMPCDLAVGIDLGTSFSVASVQRNGRIETIPNDQGNMITPSVVSVSDEGEFLIGDAARNLFAHLPGQTFYGVKRLIGKKFTDKDIQGLIPKLTYSVVKCSKTSTAEFAKLFGLKSVTLGTSSQRPCIQFRLKKDSKVEIPVEVVSAMVLGYIKKYSSQYLGCSVEKVVITVPAYFEDSQKAATLEAANMAELEVLRILPEPSSASLAFALAMQTWKAAETVLVFDFGGGTLDISVVDIDNGMLEVKAKTGDNYLGGEDFDEMLVNHFLEVFKTNTKLDASSNQRARSRLKLIAESTKKTLSFQTHVDVAVDHLFNNKDFVYKMSRAKFEQLAAPFFERLLPVVQAALDDAKLSKHDITQVILVGGSTRIPRVRQLLTSFFGQEPSHQVHADEAVAVGAAILASKMVHPDQDEASAVGDSTLRSFLSHIFGDSDKNKDSPKKEFEQRLDSLRLQEILPHSLGVAVQTDDHARGDLRLSIILPRQIKIPAEQSSGYTTTSDFQTSVDVKVLEGENPIALENKVLGSFELKNIEQARKGVPKLKFTFRVDENGVLHVLAVDERTRSQGNITLANIDWPKRGDHEIRFFQEVVSSSLRPRSGHDEL